jgi:hypothetical protein
MPREREEQASSQLIVVDGVIDRDALPFEHFAEGDADLVRIVITVTNESEDVASVGFVLMLPGGVVRLQRRRPHRAKEIAAKLRTA